MSDPDLTAAVKNLFPVDGPHTPDTAVAALASAAELIRYLNHATLGPRAAAEVLPAPADAAQAIASLSVLFRYAAQFSSHLETHFAAISTDPRLTDDRLGKMESHTTARVRTSLRAITTQLSVAGELADSAFGQASHLGIVTAAGVSCRCPDGRCGCGGHS